MRIIAGQFKGRRLLSPGNQRLRPTSGRVREAVFDVLGEQVSSSRVLDLFAGTGAFGFEALSRGASEVAFVEKNRCIAKHIQKSAQDLGVADRISLRICEAAYGLKMLCLSKETFTIIFLDPPYDARHIDRLWQKPELARVMAPRCVLVVELRDQGGRPKAPDFMFKWFARQYGDTRVEMFRLEEGG